MPNANGAILALVKATSVGGLIGEETLPFNLDPSDDFGPHLTVSA